MNLMVLLPFLNWFRMVNRETIKADLVAGFTGAVIVLPQGVAFAMIAGLPPEYGLYTAMVTPIVAALFGSSYHLVSGPTTAISIVVFATVSQYATPGSPEFIQLVLTVTLLTGVYQLAFGLARLGTLVNFVSHTVVIGFTAGAAVLIATSQMKHVFGLDLPKGESFLATWYDVFTMTGDINGYVLFIALATLITGVIIKSFLPKIPNLLVAMVVGSIVALTLGGESEGVKLVGEIPAHLPPLSMPDLSLETIRQLAPDAFAIAMLGLIEAVSISRAIATRSNQSIQPNQEFVGQGISNIFGSFFSSYAGSGSFTRSGVNYSAGARTPMSAIFAALFLMVLVLFLAPLTAYLPVAAMGGVILIVAYNLIDFHHIKHILKFSRSEAAVLLTTFFATLFLELEFAIYLGVILSLVIFLSRTSTPQIPTLSLDEDSDTGSRSLVAITDKPLKQCPQLKIIRIDMSVYFGSITHIQQRLQQISDNERIYKILIVGSGINLIDLSAAEVLVNENKRLQKLGGGLYFVGLKASVYEFAARTCFIKKVGKDHFFDSKTEAFKSLYKTMDREVCAKCPSQIFKECK